MADSASRQVSDLSLSVTHVNLYTESAIYIRIALSLYMDFLCPAWQVTRV